MPLTQLDAVTALVVIDLQQSILGLPTAHPPREILLHAAKLADAFRAKKLPVVLVNVAGGAPGRNDAQAPKFAPTPDLIRLAPELNAQPSDLLITKHRWGAFTGTALHEELQRRGVTQIVLAGIATSLGVESTARSASELGYNVALVSDAMTDRSLEAHQNSLERIFPRLGEVDTTDRVLSLLER